MQADVSILLFKEANSGSFVSKNCFPRFVRFSFGSMGEQQTIVLKMVGKDILPRSIGF